MLNISTSPPLTHAHTHTHTHTHTPGGDPPTQGIQCASNGGHEGVKVAVLEVKEEVFTLCLKLLQLIYTERERTSNHLEDGLVCVFLTFLALDGVFLVKVTDGGEAS